MPRIDVAGLMWDELQRQIKDVRGRVDEIAIRYERAELAGGVDAVLLANAPLAVTGGVKAGSLLFITNGRKPGEGGGAGTGVLAYYQSSLDQWLRTSDDTAVVI